MSLLVFVLGIPAGLAAVSFLVRRIKVLAVCGVVGHGFVLALTAVLLQVVNWQGKMVLLGGAVHVDALSAFFLFTIAFVNFASSLYSVGYVAMDVDDEKISENKARMYYLLFNVFSLTMYLVTVVNNLGMLWVCIEMTTLVSAFLVGFYRTKESVEAAWKYIIICSAGIILALLGTILFAYAMSVAGGIKSLNWTDLAATARHFDKNIVRIAFIFILVGYGTKAGLAPMHTWLPDAHSQAIAPISALLSGVLLKTALYAILRYIMIVNTALGSADFTSHLLIIFGLASLAVASVFIVVQKDLKRLLAYSSIEHIGIITLGFGLGGPVGITGALLHIFNHAVSKSLMFFGAGAIVRHYRRHDMNSIHGVIQAMPFTGMVFLLGAFVLTGFPPFSMFMSELLVALAGFGRGAYGVVILFLFFLAVIFGGILYHLSGMLFGHRPKGVDAAREPASIKWAMAFLLFPACVLGLVVPPPLQEGIKAVIKLVQGG
ncbi:MAG: hydrogenase 4 subunit F [Candidatus Omnitrophota bacterium]|nr:hydrogenase 4 subunit F [Candidatus Omnitrophota bacterium]MDZ4243246.1 hydrogenase 4 subunit F [Candidatus Omnitrophota bacterium]